MRNLLMTVCLLIALLAMPAPSPSPRRRPVLRSAIRGPITDGRQIKVVKIEDGGPVMTGALRGLCRPAVVHYDRNLAIRKVTDTEAEAGGGGQARLPRAGPGLEVLRVSRST